MAITIAVELHVQRYQKSVFLVIELLLAVSQLLHFLSNSFPLHYISSRSLFGMEDMITDEGIEYRASFVMWLIYSVFKNRKKNECDNKSFNEMVFLMTVRGIFFLYQLRKYFFNFIISFDMIKRWWRYKVMKIIISNTSLHILYKTLSEYSKIFPFVCSPFCNII